MEGDRYEKYILAVLEEVPEAECWAESLFDSFRQYEEEFLIPPRDAVRSVIRLAKKLIEPPNSGRHQDDAVEPDWIDKHSKEWIMDWFMQRMDSVPEGARMDVKIALSYEKDGAWYDV